MEKDDKPEKDEYKIAVKIRLGDIIQIYAPSNEPLHEQTFFIEYIDEALAVLLDVAAMKQYSFHFDEDGYITDESIQNIYILSHSEEEGYARQNSLVPKTWVDVYIGGDVPSIITGEITNLEQDMIEITTYPESDIIYIDFAYKGIPRDIPIQHFEIRDPPQHASPVETLEEVLEEENPLDKIASSEDFSRSVATVIRTEQAEIPEKNMFDLLNSMYINADGIIFGEELEELTQVIELPETQRKYGIEIQANDLMDELLSTIPNSQRTKAILNRIHSLIERFKQLREMFSIFDENGNISGYIKLGPLHKPLIKRLLALDTKMSWVVPVVKQKQFIYGSENTPNIGEEPVMGEEEAPDVIYSNIQTEIDKQKELFKNYYKNTLPNGVNKYEYLYSKIDELQSSFVPENCKSECLVEKQEIMENIDAIIDNLDDFYSTTLSASTKRENLDNLHRRRFVIQRYNLGMMKKNKQTMRSGKTVYMRDYMTPSDKITLKSLVMMPEPIVKFSHIDLPMTNIMTKVNLHQSMISLFRLFRKNTDISSYIVDNLEKEILYANDDTKQENLPEFVSNIKEYLLEENLQNDPKKYQKFLNVVIPKTRVLFRIMRKYIRDKLSFVEIIKELEPFMIYTQDISYKQHDEIRYFIKNKIVEYKQNLVKRAQIFKNIRKMTNKTPMRMNQIRKLLFDHRELLHTFETAYGFGVNDDWSKIDVSEVIRRMIECDNAVLFSDILTTLTVKTLSTPENILDGFEPAKLDDLTDAENIRARDCTRRYLAKKYKNMTDLRKDNNTEDVFYDKELDDTVYSILDKYKSEKKAMAPNEFADFLRLNLIHKYQVSSDNADTLAKTLIEGRKRVNEGEYAILEIPTRNNPEVETTVYEYIYKYFRRVKTHWVEDNTIDEFTFVDNNTLFCNSNIGCFKNDKNAQCEPMTITKRRLLEQTKARMKDEFDIRLSGSLEELERGIKAKLETDYKRILKERLLFGVKMEKYNNLAYELGRELVHEEVVVSPHWKLRELILGQDDFQKRQSDIVEFVDMYCREPMIDELNENANWLYCIDTNTPLFPQSLSKLAIVYVEGADYPAKLAEICKDVGILSDDGDSIVDKHTGYVLRKIDFITQDEYSDEGMKIMSHAIMEDDIQTRLSSLFKKDEPAPIFEGKQNQSIYNITRTICSNMGIPIEIIQDFVMNTTGELVEKIVQTPELYEERAKLMEKKKGVRPIPYEIYKDRLIFWIIASCILIAVQIAIPSIRTKKTFPGCVRSFSGFPLVGGVEDLTGLKYIACVLFKSKSSTAPWNAIEKLDLDTYVAKIREMLEKILGERVDIGELYTKKREFLLLNPNEVVPEEHSITKWRSFLPPLVDFTIKRVQPITKEYEQETMDLIRDGHKYQREHIDLYHSVIVLNNYAMIEAINHIVSQKDALLKTSNKIPFLENACCHDQSNAAPIVYFANENKEIIQHIKTIKHASVLLREFRFLGEASMLYHPVFTGIKYATVGEVVFTENIYKAIFHYCNFDNDLAIPEPYREICPEKPSGGYQRDWSILEKIEFLKINGKQYRPENLEQLMMIVRNQNRVTIPELVTYTQVDKLREIVEEMHQRNSSVIEGAFRKHLLAVIANYNPQKMIEEPREELNKFKNYLAKANEKMYYEIVDFVDKFGNLSNDEYSKFQDWLLSLVSEDTDTNKKTQNSSNFVYFISRLIPRMILNRKIYDRIPSHWDLAPIHIRDLERVLDNHWNKFQPFFEDTVIYELLRDVSVKLEDMCIFVQNFPVYSPIIKDEHVFHSFLDLDATNMIYVYFVYSTLYEYIVSSENPDLLRTDIEEIKKEKRKAILENVDESLQSSGKIARMDDDDEKEYDLDLQEINIRVGSQEVLKERIGGLLKSFMAFEIENRVGLISYDDIIRKTGLSKKEEKKRITDYLGNLPNDEREIEKQFMKYKMGQWNVGEQRGLFAYDKGTYEREREQQDLGVFTTGGVEVDALDAEREQNAAEEHDAEGMDFGELGEDFRDGVFYEEDRDEDDF